MTTIVSQYDYEEAVECSMGFCTTCQSFTRDSTEPDAQDYDCPECGENTVMGAEDALLTGTIELSEEDEENE